VNDALGLLIVIILVLFTAFFVAAEFAIVKIRATKLDVLIRQGSRRAKAAKQIIHHLNAYLSTTQLGISVTALILGWIGEPVVAHFFHPLFHLIGLNSAMTTTFSTLTGFLLVTILSVVLGELAPKGIAIQKAEQITLAVTYPLIWIHRLFFPFVWLLNALSNGVMRLFGFRPDETHETALTENELRLTLSNSFKGGQISRGELRYMNRIFDFHDRTAREIMVPRTEIICVYQEDPFETSLKTIHDEKFTRFPVAVDDKDHIVGMINIKDIFNDILTTKVRSLDAYVRPILSVLETIPVRSLLERMQRESVHMAVLTDEYGGTSGLVTAEDIIEEIFGEIRDEYDETEEPPIRKMDNGQIVADGKLLIVHVNSQFQTDIEEEGLDTIGGWMLAQDPGIHKGSILTYKNLSFEVLDMDPHQIKKIKITKSNISGKSQTDHHKIAPDPSTY
jgi:CBS domain containing-hemolysin-like protein